MKFLSRAFATLTIAALAALSMVRVDAQNAPSVVTVPFQLVGNGAGPVLNLTAGQGNCTVTVYSLGAGGSITPQYASDGLPPNQPNTWSTVIGINSNSPITGPGVFGGAITGAPTNFRINVTGLSAGGTAVGFETCSTSAASNAGGGGGSVTQGTTPWLVGGQGTAGTPATGVVSVQGITAGFPLPVSGTVTVNTAPTPPAVSPYAVAAQLVVCPSTPPAAANSTYIASCDSTGRLNVSTPAPAPTLATYLQATAMLVCPSTAPAVSNSTYIATCDSSGFQNVNIKSTLAPSTPVPVPSATATNMAATPAPVKTSGPLIFYQGIYTNSDTATIYCMIYDSATSPSLGTTVPKFTVAVPAGQTMPVFSSPTQGVLFASGIYGACSTTYNGATNETAGKVFFTALWGQ